MFSIVESPAETVSITSRPCGWPVDEADLVCTALSEIHVVAAAAVWPIAAIALVRVSPK